MAVKFGPKKVGQAAFELSKVKARQTQKFGPRKFGAKKAALMRTELAEAEAKVNGDTTPAEAPPATTSIKQMAVALTENPTHLDEFIALEVARPGGPRKGAIKLFLGTEMSKDEGPRDEVLATLRGLI